MTLAATASLTSCRQLSRTGHRFGIAARTQVKNQGARKSSKLAATPRVACKSFLLLKLVGRGRMHPQAFQQTNSGSANHSQLPTLTRASKPR